MVYQFDWSFQRTNLWLSWFSVLFLYFLYIYALVFIVSFLLALGQLIFENDAKEIQWKKGHVFNKWCWRSWPSRSKKLNLDLNLTFYTKINSKLFINLSVERKSIKHFLENKRKFSRSKAERFSDTMPKVCSIKGKLDKFDFIKTKTFALWKDPGKR